LRKAGGDPIGVGDIPEAAGEYDDYVGQVAARLREGASESEVAGYHAGVRVGVFGLPEQTEADERVAGKIVEWYQAATGPVTG
jgi:hypothetical protein